MPSIFITISEQEAGTSELGAILGRMLGGTPSGGLGWWWHSEHDTIDKVDEQNLVRDTQVYALALARLIFSPVLPFNYADTADEFAELLQGLQEEAGDAFDLSPCLAKATLLQSRTLRLQEAAAQAADTADSATDPRAQKINECFHKLARALVPINYGAVDRFDQSRARSIPPIAVLQPVAELAKMEPGSHDFHVLETRLARERNKVCHALNEACQAVEETLAEL
jgi:hypothetical protein